MMNQNPRNSAADAQERPQDAFLVSGRVKTAWKGLRTLKSRQNAVSALIGKIVEDEELGRGIIVGHENGIVYVSLDAPGCQMLVIHENSLELNDLDQRTSE
jgi:hypothetical protein